MLARELIALIERHSGKAGRPAGRNVRLLCPAHDDHHPSLDVAANADGTALVVCRSHGCTYEQILAALGVAESHPNGDDEWTPYGEALAVYHYLGADRQLVFDVCRVQGKQFPQRRPDASARSGWRWNLDGVERVLYRLPDVLAAVERGETVYVVEGEKDVERLRKLGLCATCNPGGAGKWRDAYAAVLSGASVVVIADRDPAGLQHAQAVAGSLVQHGARVELRQPLVDGQDVSDHLAAGGSLETLATLPLDATSGESVAITVETLRAFLDRDVPPAESLVGVTRDGTNLLPRFGWVLPWGREGSGKTSILVDLLFHVCAGIDWLNYAVERPLRVVCVINEGIPGGLQDKLRLKHERWQHDRDLVLDNLAFYVSPWGEFSFRDETMVAHLRAWALDFGADYVAFDPLHTLSAIGAGAPNETEEFKHRLRAFGMWSDLGVLTAHHANKGGMVSGDWGRHPDTVIHVEKDGKNPSTKFTLEKARPADPAELHVPVLLKWIVETLGYERVEIETTAMPVDEPKVLAEVLDRLAQSSSPLALDPLIAGIEGTKTTLREIVKRALQRGDIVNLARPAEAGKRQTFRLVLSTAEKNVETAPTLFDAPEREVAENGSTKPNNNVDEGSTLADVQGDPTEGAKRTSNVDPPIGGETFFDVHSSADADAENPFL